MEAHVLQFVHGHCRLVLDSVRYYYQPTKDAWGGCGREGSEGSEGGGGREGVREECEGGV